MYSLFNIPFHASDELLLILFLLLSFETEDLGLQIIQGVVEKKRFCDSKGDFDIKFFHLEIFYALCHLKKNIQLYNYQTVVIEKQLVEPHKPLPLYGQSKIRHTINAYTTMYNLVKIPFHASDEIYQSYSCCCLSKLKICGCRSFKGLSKKRFCDSKGDFDR